MLEFKNLSITRGDRRVIDNISAAADRGDVVALFGPNGAGKTTLLHCIAGMLESDSGDISYRENVVDTTALDWKSRLSYVLDDGGTIPLLTVEEQIFLQCLLTGISKDEANDRTEGIIDLIGLEKHRGYRADALSAGLRKRLGIGLGVVRDAEVYLFDEPLSSLDVDGMALFLKIVMELKDKGRILIIASHGFSYLQDICSRVWSLSGGNLADQYGKENLLRFFHNGSGTDAPKPEILDIPWITDLVYR